MGISERNLTGAPGDNEPALGGLLRPGQRQKSAADEGGEVTGANSGFGRAITEAAVAAGDVVVATARRVAALDDLAAAHPGQVDVLPLDGAG